VACYEIAYYGLQVSLCSVNIMVVGCSQISIKYTYINSTAMFLVQLLFLVCAVEVGCGAQAQCPAAVSATTLKQLVLIHLSPSSRKECFLAAC
jgi:hypothetical protein